MADTLTCAPCELHAEAVFRVEGAPPVECAGVLLKVPYAIRLARATLRNVRTNVIVVGNALRLLRSR